MHHYRESGLDRVFLANGYRIETDEEFGDLLVIEDIDRLHRAIAIAIVTAPAPLTGSDLRFLRTEMDLTQKALAVLLATNEQSVAKFEKERDKPMGNRPMERLLKAMVMNRFAPDIATRFLATPPASGQVPQAPALIIRHEGGDWREIR